MPTATMFKLLKRLPGPGKEPLVETKWEGLVPALTSGKIDMIIAGMSPTAERKQEIAFSSSYYTSEPVLLVKRTPAWRMPNLWKTLVGAKSCVSTRCLSL